MEHTPGPWEIGGMDGQYFPHVFIGPELRFPDNSGSFRPNITVNEGPSAEEVAQGIGFGSHMGVCQANARLIAAAPDYAEAAELAIACMVMEGDHKNHDVPCWLDKMALAHAKAIGATP